MRVAAVLLALVAVLSVPALAESVAAGPQVSASNERFEVVLSTSTGSARMGEPIDVLLQVSADAPEIRVSWPDLRGALTSALSEDVVEVVGGRERPGNSYLATVHLYDVGTFDLPPLTVSAWSVDAEGAETPLGEVEVAGIAIEVPATVPDEAEPAPSEGMLDIPELERPRDWSRYARIGIIAAAVLVVLAIVFLLLRRRLDAPVVEPPPPPPHVTALDALHELAARGLAERGEIDAYFVGLTGILRRYLEDRFGLRAPEQTTEEFLHDVTSTAAGRAAIHEAHRTVLRDFLTQSDLVKFARETPAVADCLRMGETAEAFVRETAPSAPVLDDPARSDT